MRPEEWQFLNMKVTLMLRIVRFSFPNIYSALTVCIYFISFFVCMYEKGDTSSSWSRTVTKTLHPSPLCVIGAMR